MGDGPWAWRRARYTLLDGALDEGTTLYSHSSISKLRSLGTAMRTQDGSQVSFDFDNSPPLQLSLGATFEEAGVGSQLWEASIALALFQRSHILPLPQSARVLELGCGLGLPSLDMARWQGERVPSRVLLTDSRSRLIDLANENAATMRNTMPWATEVQTTQLDWNTHDEAHQPLNADVIIGSDICYEPASVPPLASFLERFAAPLTIIIGPTGRPSMKMLREMLCDSPMLSVEEKRLTLVSEDADKPRAPEEEEEEDHMMRSSGVYSLVIVRPAAQAPAAAMA